MNKFVFKLEPLYEYRRRIHEICEKDFAAALAKLRGEEERLGIMKEMYMRSSAEMDSLKEKGSSSTELSLYAAYLAGLKTHMAEQEKIIRSFMEELEAKRAKLVGASKDRKAVEIMKEKSLDAFRQEAEKEEQKDLDDLNCARFKRSS